MNRGIIAMAALTALSMPSVGGDVVIERRADRPQPISIGTALPRRRRATKAERRIARTAMKRLGDARSRHLAHREEKSVAPRGSK